MLAPCRLRTGAHTQDARYRCVVQAQQLAAQQQAHAQALAQQQAQAQAQLQVRAIY
jgi:hypothetical protein